MRENEKYFKFFKKVVFLENDKLMHMINVFLIIKTI